MKKILYALALILPVAILANLGDATAQRKNYTSHDVKRSEMPAPAPQNMTGCNCAQMMGCNCNKMMGCKSGCAAKMKPGKGHGDDKMKKHKMAEKQGDLNEDYHKALKKIQHSNFSPEQKDLLTRQARENRDFSMAQMKARAELRMRHRQQRMDMNMQNMMQEESNRKALKKVDKIN